MKRLLLAGCVFAAGGALLGQAEPDKSYFALGQIDFGVEGTHADSDSSKFREYRELPNGPFLPFLRLSGDQKLRYDVVIENGFRDDARYRVFVDYEPIRVRAEYNSIPHRFGNDGRTLLQEASRGVLVISDTVQQANQAAIQTQFARSPAGVNFAFLSGLVAPQLAAANRIDLELLRQRGFVELGLTPGHPVDVKFSYFQERRSGNRPAGTSFGFGNVVESPEPIAYRTQDLGLSAEYARPWGLVRGAVHYNTFRNGVDSLVFDNPFRATDSTDPNAYTAPGAGSINGSSRGRVDLSPDNKAATGSVGVLFRLPANSRFTADASLSRWSQDRPFLPYTINSAITVPFRADDPANLPAQSLDGRIDVKTVSLLFSSRPLPALGFSARYRVYDLDNKTRRIDFPGYARFDAVWEPIARTNVPYSYKRTQGDATVTYDLGPATLEGGYRYLQWDRTFRETERTRENTVIGAVNLRAVQWMTLRASYERGSRNHDTYDYVRGEDASFGEPAPAPTNLPALRRFDQASRTVDRVVALLQLTPIADLTASLSYGHNKENYDREAIVDPSGLRYGLVSASADTFTAEADYSPGERWSVYGFYTREINRNFQRGRQSGAVPSTNPLDDWTSNVHDGVHSFSLGGTAVIVPEKFDFRAMCRYQNFNGNNDLASPPGGTPDVAFPISNFDDTRTWTVSAELAWHLAKSWTVAAGGWLEEYRTNDSATTGLSNYVPGSFFLAANDGSYKARVGYVKASYHF